MNVMNDQDPSTFSPRADDVTTASAWSSSPLGDPADEAEYHPYRYNFPPDPITRPAGPKSISKATLAAGLVGTIGVGAALAMAIFVYTDSSQVRPMTVVPGSTGVPAAFPPGGAPDIGSAPAQAVTPPDYGPPPADPGSPPVAPSGPVVIVNTPALPPIWLPLPHQVPPPPPPPPPPACHPPHHLVLHVCI
jgi:hypothetical protein